MEGELTGLDALTEGMVVAQEVLDDPAATITEFAVTPVRTWLLVRFPDGRKYLVVVPRQR